MNLENFEAVLADRGQRFLAVLIDSVGPMLPVFIVVMMFPEKKSIPDAVNILIGLYVLAVVVGQAVLLCMRGQTLGKKVMNIKIVRRKDGENGGFVTNILLRVVVNGLLGLIPFYQLVDVLFIFSSDKRCLHDKIAGTIVVKAAS